MSPSGLMSQESRFWLKSGFAKRLVQLDEEEAAGGADDDEEGTEDEEEDGTGDDDGALKEELEIVELLELMETELLELTELLKLMGTELRELVELLEMMGLLVLGIEMLELMRELAEEDGDATDDDGLHREARATPAPRRPVKRNDAFIVATRASQTLR